ncbi:MAG: FHA domain-containing protein [Burkholderiales bacterium]|nr:FHA domain-containing protein [Burkholderiales bacterium]
MNQPGPDSSVPPLATAEHFLACVDVMVDWAALDAMIEAASAGARTPLTLPAIKIALLKQWYGIAEAEAAFAVLDRISFRAFVGYKDDGTPADAAIVQELSQAAWSRHPATEELMDAVHEQLRELGYAVRAGQLREPSIAPCTESSEEAPNADTTSLFRPGELGRMVEAVTEKAHSQGNPLSAAHEPDPPRESAPALGGAPTTLEAEPVRAVLEWPWGQKSEISAHLNIGRDYAFSPLARELTPYTHVSRKHAELLVYGDGVWVRDLGSRNGTYVNNDEVPKGQAYLIDGDAIIRFGPLLAVSLKIKV